MKYKISVKALEDIENIWLYTLENWSEEQADRYLNLIFDEIRFVAQNPFHVKDLGDVRKNYRCSKVKSHLIFFKIIDQEMVEVIRVLHEKMDVESRLTE